MKATYIQITSGDFAHLKRTSVLISAYINGTISGQDLQELEEWKNKNQYNKTLFAKFTNPAFIHQLRMEKYN